MGKDSSKDLGLAEDARIPRHVAIIMDGNGRWANVRGLPRTAGHQQGIEACKRAVRAAMELKVPFLTLFGFSTENWRRPADEISELMRLLRMYLRSETAELHRNNIKLRMVGDRIGMPKDVIELIESAEDLTSSNTGLTVVMALNYGGRHDILQAAARMAQYFQEKGIVPNFETAEEFFEQHLYTQGIPDPDILIRTSGEQRISNFLLWQSAYTEYVFTETLWPDFDKSDMIAAIEEYSHRERRFGRVEQAT